MKDVKGDVKFSRTLLETTLSFGGAKPPPSRALHVGRKLWKLQARGVDKSDPTDQSFSLLLLVPGKPIHCQGKAITGKSQQCKGKIKNCFANNKDNFLVGLRAVGVESASHRRHTAGKSSKLANIKWNATFLRPNLQISYKIYFL